MKKHTSSVVVLLLLVAAMLLQCVAAQTVHVVGDSIGWTIPQDGAQAYETWAASNQFVVGDVLRSKTTWSCCKLPTMLHMLWLAITVLGTLGGTPPSPSTSTSAPASTRTSSPPTTPTPTSASPRASSRRRPLRPRS